jgi:hypothetical protein
VVNARGAASAKAPSLNEIKHGLNHLRQSSTALAHRAQKRSAFPAPCASGRHRVVH